MLFTLPPYARQYKKPPKDISTTEGLAMSSFVSILSSAILFPLIGPFALIPAAIGVGTGAGAVAMNANNKKKEVDNNMPKVVRAAVAPRIPTAPSDIHPSCKSPTKLNRISFN